ncbi:hypothetical protein HNQ93_004402 [Hymenobacter luteus]|uniref:Uncharacterized protein n=2 Tax=Hymenobacter TaxID=89966 RepID=A0A7W9WEI7_9BACT|nr:MULTISPECIES: hypothetical protein [Hymenobacter]MBB4603756.1 hypothetical protein [Hymenobacter latericoloratus]MBB6061521.1 hypothetical protein [Hymenobacter luteus]
MALMLLKATFLATRFSPEGAPINLYYLGSFFAEVHLDARVTRLPSCRCFASSLPLDAYIRDIQLPPLV